MNKECYMWTHTRTHTHTHTIIPQQEKIASFSNYPVPKFWELHFLKTENYTPNNNLRFLEVFFVISNSNFRFCFFLDKKSFRLFSF